MQTTEKRVIYSTQPLAEVMQSGQKCFASSCGKTIDSQTSLISETAVYNEHGHLLALAVRVFCSAECQLATEGTR